MATHANIHHIFQLKHYSKPTSSPIFISPTTINYFPIFGTKSNFHRKIEIVGIAPLRASLGKEGIIQADEDGVSLGTVKLPSNVNIPRFESLLFQWGNSLCQGANLPYPVPLKVDKIEGGVRLGFIEIEDGKTEVRVYIDCLVFPATQSSGPLFMAIRNGALKDRVPPGEPRIMRNLLEALQKCIQIATLQ